MRWASGSIGNVLFMCDSYKGVNFVLIPHEVHFFCAPFLYGCYISQ